MCLFHLIFKNLVSKFPIQILSIKISDTNSQYLENCYSTTVIYDIDN